MSRNYTVSEQERQRRADQMRVINAQGLAKQQSTVGEREPGPSGTRAFFGADLEEMGPWLFSRLRGRFTNLTEHNYVGFFRGCTGSNEWLFIRTRNAVGLATLTHRPLQPIPFLEEVFVLCREGKEAKREQQAEMVDIYRHFRQWMTSHGCQEALLDNLTDLPLAILKKDFDHKLRVRDVCVYRPDYEREV